MNAREVQQKIQRARIAKQLRLFMHGNGLGHLGCWADQLAGVAQLAIEEMDRDLIIGSELQAQKEQES